MALNTNYRPRLADMALLGGVSTTTEVDANLEAASKKPRITSKETLAGRQGYAADFLGEFVVPWPKLTALKAGDVLAIQDSAENRLDYTHFSVTMSQSRRMAIYVGVNINGLESVSIERINDKWSYDGRLPLEAQIGEELYTGNLLDRGHLVRREDPNWGNDAETANEDTFHFTNSSPQMAGFNQKTWLSLENYILKNARKWRERVTVFSGPIFREDDLTYRNVRIPSAYWKVVAFLSDDGHPSASAYMIEQSRELGSLEAAFGAFKTYQRSINQIQTLTGIDFGLLSQFDGFSNEELMTGTHIEAELSSPQDIRV